MVTAAAADLPHPRLDDDGMLVVQGKRLFVLGSYWNPKTAAGLAELRQAGFNLVSSGADRASLDAVAGQNLLAWIPLGAKIAPANDGQQRQLESLVQPLLDHPALAVWEVPDEALWNAWYLRQQQLAAERTSIENRVRELEKAGKDASPIRTLMGKEARARARADWMAAEALDREIRKLLGAPGQNPEIQMSRAPTAAEQLRKQLLRGYRVLHQIDGRPVWMNYAPRNTIADLQRYAEAADIVGCDIYPVPFGKSNGHSDLQNQRLSSVGDYTQRFGRLEGNRPAWMVLQGFGWLDIRAETSNTPAEAGRRPTQRESRFMLYDAIVRGARGVLYWGVNYAQEPPTFWNELKSVVHEAATLGDVWAARDADLQVKTTFEPTMGSVDRPPRVLAKKVGARTYLLVVNEHYEGLVVRLEGLGELDGATASIVGDWAGCNLPSQRAENGTLAVQMPGYSVAIVLVERSMRE
jgi:hypothetical protein